MVSQIQDAFLSAAERLEIDILEMDGEADHVHVLVAYPPKLAVSVLVNNLKSISSRYVRRLNAQLPRQSKSGALWSRSYFACSTGGCHDRDIEKLRQSATNPGLAPPYIPARIGRGYTGKLLKRGAKAPQ